MKLARVVFFGNTEPEACRVFNRDVSRQQSARLLDGPAEPGSLGAVAVQLHPHQLRPRGSVGNIGAVHPPAESRLAFE
jgi:hypothetical protein